NLDLVNQVKEFATVSQMIEFSTMLSTTGRERNKSLFTRIKTVDEKYPLYGEVDYEPIEAYERMQREPNTILINESLSKTLNIKINEQVKVQDQNFTVIGIIKSVPDVSGFVAFGDWALAGKQTLEILKLNGIGSFLNYEEIIINEKMKITFLPAVHWSKRSLTDTNKTLWGNFLIEYDGKKILFACDTGVGNVYKEIGEKYGPIDINIINIGAYNFYPITPYKDKSSYHTSPEEALQISRDLKSKKVIGMHWGTFVLSLEPIMEPRDRFRDNAEKYGFKKEDALVFKIGQITPLNEILK
ncbi:hypothetical protein IDG88_03660, partial [Pelagibacterales bacterium SAG-MED03]|nr:hypothetical protein [Pelagibacterales bacterium SAG-MED03]